VAESGEYRQPWENPVEYLRAILTPAFIIGLPLAAACFRMARLSLRDVAGSRHLLTARASGLSEWRVRTRHVMPSAAPPVITLVGVNLSALVFNAVLIEVPFNMPGAFRLADVGQHLGENGHSPENAALQGIVLVSAAIIAVAMLLCDVLNAWLDPKLRR
jgi:ABC-type dipeptide/oligopeptide/nickel transport system permease component